MPDFEHTIRLRGGWEWRDPATGVSRRVALPLTLPAQDVVGAVLIRRFNAPRLDQAEESVWLQMKRVPGLRSIRLNGRELAQPETGMAEVVLPLDSLGPAGNVLALELGSVAAQLSGSEGADWGHVALLIGRGAAQ